MAVQPQTPHIEHIANGSTTSFPLEFDCENHDHLIVLVDDLEPVVGAWSLNGGAVVFTVAPAVNKKITIQRNTPFERERDYQSYDNSFRPPAVNKDFDWIWLKLQELGVADWILGNRINALKNYVDRKDDELKAYLLEEIRKQGVALDQLDEYYNYLMERLAQIAVDKGWDASFVVDGDENQHQINDRSKQYVDTISDLFELSIRRNGQLAEVSRFSNDHQFGGGTFRFNQSRVLENDGISVFFGWERCQLPEKISPYLAGAKGDYLSDDIEAMEKAQFFARQLKTSVLVNGNFAVSRELILRSGDSFVGTKLSSRIKKLNTNLSTLEPRLAPERAANSYDEYDVDAVVILYPEHNRYVHGVTFQNIDLYNKVYGDGNPGEYGVYAPRVASLDISGVRLENVKRAFKSKNIYQSRIKDFVAIATQATNFVNEGELAFDISDNFAGATGTSNFFDNLLFVNYQRGFYVENLQTSTFLKCYGEQIHAANGAEDSVNFRFVNPLNITLISCGQEQTRCTPLYIQSDGALPGRSSISIDGFQAIWGTMGTSVNLGLNLMTIIGPVDVSIKTSTMKKDQFEIFDGIFMSGPCRVFNEFSQIGNQVIKSADSLYIDIEKTVMNDGDSGMIKSSVAIGDDLNNGIEWREGVVNKTIKGATKNVPAGITDAWGVSTYYGLSENEGIQILNLANSTHAWKRQILSKVNFGEWLAY